MPGPLLDIAALRRTPGAIPPASDSAKKLRDAAEQFEALLVQTMIQSMRQTVEEEKEGDTVGGDSLGKETYYDLMYEQMARAISKNSRLGLTEMIEEKVTAMQKAQGKVESADN